MAMGDIYSPWLSKSYIMKECSMFKGLQKICKNAPLFMIKKMIAIITSLARCISLCVALTLMRLFIGLHVCLMEAKIPNISHGVLPVWRWRILVWPIQTRWCNVKMRGKHTKGLVLLKESSRYPKP